MRVTALQPVNLRKKAPRREEVPRFRDGSAEVSRTPFQRQLVVDTPAQVRVEAPLARRTPATSAGDAVVFRDLGAVGAVRLVVLHGTEPRVPWRHADGGPFGIRHRVHGSLTSGSPFVYQSTLSPATRFASSAPDRIVFRLMETCGERQRYQRRPQGSGRDQRSIKATTGRGETGPAPSTGPPERDLGRPRSHRYCQRTERTTACFVPSGSVS